MGAETIITGNCGPNAMTVFSQSNIPVVTGQAGLIQEVVERFKRGELSASAVPTVEEKAGMSGGGSGQGANNPQGPGQGMGGGRGIGCGGGRGIGGGGRGMGGGGGRGMGGGGGGGRGMGGGRRNA
jgi:hypothetical protein